MNVKIIKKTGKTALVEYIGDGHYRRVFVPSSSVKNNQVDDGVLQTGAKYGLDWSAAVKSALDKISVDDIANELRRHNIYRGYELTENLGSVRAAIWQSAGAQILTELINLSNKDKEE